MTGPQMVRVKTDEDGLRLDRWFKARYPALGHGALQKMLRKGQIRVEGGRVQANRRLEAGETVRVPPIEDDPAQTKPLVSSGSRADARERIAPWIVYEDSDMLVFNKPFGLAVQGGAKTHEHIDGLLVQAFGKENAPRLVHRLDRDTGGLLVTAKTRKAAQWLTEAFRAREMAKEYWALVAGLPEPAEGRIDRKLEKSGPAGREKARFSEQGQIAITDFQVVDSAGLKASFVALRPITGRTHQLRAHMEMLGTPIVGDGKYGGALAKVEGLPAKMHLFCRRLSIPRPGRRPLALEAELTGHMLDTWKLFAFDQNAYLEWPEDLQ